MIHGPRNIKLQSVHFLGQWVWFAFAVKCWMKVVLVRYRFVSKRPVNQPTRVTSRCLVLRARCDMKKVNVVRSTRPHGRSGLHCCKLTVLAAGPKRTAHKSSAYPEFIFLFILKRVPKTAKKRYLGL